MQYCIDVLLIALRSFTFRFVVYDDIGTITPGFSHGGCARPTATVHGAGAVNEFVQGKCAGFNCEESMKRAIIGSFFLSFFFLVVAFRAVRAVWCVRAHLRRPDQTRPLEEGGVGRWWVGGCTHRDPFKNPPR